MRCNIEYIGILSISNNVHYVKFEEGLNIITGKSSTGKSALMEIFDYCFGNAINTIPMGVITDIASVYFVILSISDLILVLGRKPKSNYVFVKEETELPEIDKITESYFDKDYFLTLSNYKVELGHYFGINISETDEDLGNRLFRNYNAKSPRPTIRSFTSFILQHQNLIANKYSLFYRFDEKEKRDQTIENFKIFAGFVDQAYYILKQELAELKTSCKIVEFNHNKMLEKFEKTEQKLATLLQYFFSTSGNKLTDLSAKDILRAPKSNLEKIRSLNFELETFTDEYQKQYRRLDAEKDSLEGKRREKSLQVEKIKKTIDFYNKYKQDLENTTPIQESIYLSEQVCPFCFNKNQKTKEKANELSAAINWLNSELKKTHLLQDSLLPELKKNKEELNSIELDLKTVNTDLKKIKDTNLQLQQQKDSSKLIQLIKIKIENLLEEHIEENSKLYETELLKIKSAIEKTESVIKEKYNINSKIEAAEKYINTQLNKFGANLDFESTYCPINLKFSLENFELWHEKPDHTKVYLSAMGSGANWLNCHISLFTSLLKYFCSLGDTALVPTILFIDQPSQVYFPSTKEADEKFEDKEFDGGNNNDEDIKAVANLYLNLISFCDETEKETSIKPQIIITDHADNLQLNNYNFNDYVRARWRERGFIDEELENEIKKTDIDNAN